MEEKVIRKVKDVEFYALEEYNQFDGSKQYSVYARSKKQKQDRLIACVDFDMEDVEHCVNEFAKGFNFFNKFVLKP